MNIITDINMSIRMNSCCILLWISCIAFASNSMFVAGQSSTWNVVFAPEKVLIHMDDTVLINITITGLNVAKLKSENATIEIRSDNVIAEVNPNTIPLDEITANGEWHGVTNLKAIFLGSANIFIVIKRNGVEEKSPVSLNTVIIRAERIIDKVFTISVATLVSILYINFGAAMDLNKVKGIIIRPIGPIIAMFCHFLFLPVVSKCAMKLPYLIHYYL